jgi:cell division protein FtsA
LIPYGGNIITNDITICLKIPFSEAEKLKIKYGSLDKTKSLDIDIIKVNASFNDIVNIDYQTLIDIIEARVEELLHLVRIRLEENLQYDEVSGIVLVGGGVAMLSGICELSRNIFKKPVRIGAPEYVGASSPVYNTAVGIIKDVISSAHFSEEEDNVSETSNVKKKNMNKKMRDSDESNVVTKIKGFLADFF